MLEAVYNLPSPFLTIQSTLLLSWTWDAIWSRTLYRVKKMEPKPSRLPRRITVQPSTLSPITSRTSRVERLGGISDTYNRDSSRRHDLDYQDSSTYRNSSRDWSFRERDSFEPSWKTTTSSYQRCSGTYEQPLSGGLVSSRSRLSTSSSTPQSTYEPLERAQGTYTGLHSQQQDRDSKRPKLSYSAYSSLSGIRSTSSGLSSTSDSTSRYGRFPRTSPMMLGSSRSDFTRDRERRTDSTIHSLMDYSHRNSDTTQSYLQDRVSSYAQGARPKDNSLSTSRPNTSISHQLPSQHSSSLYSRDSTRNLRPVTSRDIRSSSQDTQTEIQHVTSRRETAPRTSGRLSPVQQRSNEQSTDVESRRSTRHLLSRIASSMSSTFFSRRSSQDSLNGRSPNTEESPSSLQNQSPQCRVATPPSADASENRSSEQSQGFAFFRRRRWGLSSVSPSQSSDSDADSYRSEDSETRSSASWLPSSLRNRCTPLFSRRRREGRSETARASSTSDTNRIHYPFRRSSSEAASADEGHGATASSPDSSTDSSSGASLADSLFSARNSGISGMLPGSFLQISVPGALSSSLSDNVMITVDVRTSDVQDSQKSQTSSRDPEKIKQIQESLLLEDSEEEDGDLCRICQTGMTTPLNPFIEPCKCSGSLQYVHQDCMKKWLNAKINSGTSLESITTCELCKEKLDLNLEDFDILELYRAHASERAEYEFISSGLYLVVLLHLCEQRFSDMLGAANEASTRFINLARTLQAHMDDLETSEEEDSEDERV
ncbi:membrane associated ring-CH-type finger 7 S homeolog isoform X2 [Xenopus laevis]|uniref:RING-type E3 ubiquitin transferase n=2 Tax=Xenopus laevis TaxID=8355 RepID=A0A8J1LYI5_XENLA|nr:membrane associated ring-CH-type finger 7 S homeolog isoform X2 [Xenopus laevis]